MICQFLVTHVTLVSLSILVSLVILHDLLFAQLSVFHSAFFGRILRHVTFISVLNHKICLWYILKITLKYVHISRDHVWSGGLEVGDHLLGVLVDLGELGGELLVLEGVAFLVEDLCQGGDEEQPLLGVDPGEVDGLAGGQLHGGALGFLASQVPEIDTIFFLI